jgi:serine/threonine-protein kinase
MRTCDACGFENAEPGKACALCGASEITAATSERSTIAAPPTPAPGGASGAARVEAGQVFGGRYRIVSLLGSGGMGQVFRVEDQAGGQPLALKVLRPLDGDDADRVRRFQREIQILTRIRHPAVLRILDWGESPAGLYFVTELVDGEDLKLAIRRRGPWPAAEAAALGATLADALAAAHAQGVVHRDVKPNNVMIARDGSVRLLDFGLARGAGIDLTALTRTGTILGTPGYMSPEQFDAHGVDERSDLYSLGVVLFEVLTGRLPFCGQTPIAMALAHKTEPPPLPRSLRRDAPAWLERVVLRCLEKQPERRYASAHELASELRRPRTGEPPRRRALPSGDGVVVDGGESTDWALVLTSPHEKTGWSEGMTLRFEERYYRMVAALAPSSDGVWTYGFEPWPEGEVFRRLVDYEQDAASREAEAASRLGGRLSRWLGRREEPRRAADEDSLRRPPPRPRTR